VRRFIAGLALGLLLSSAPSIAEWGWGDMDILKNIHLEVSQITLAVQWQARSLERMAKAAEQRCVVLPPENPKQ
jgi:hypothetical protein